MSSFLTIKVSKLLLAGGSALLLGTNAFSAQISRGGFTLPFQTQWGGAVMPPGSYSYSLDQASVGLVVFVRGEGMSAQIPASGAVTTGEASKGSTLVLVTEGGMTSVRSMQFGHLGVTLHYKAPKTGNSSHSNSEEATSKISVR